MKDKLEKELEELLKIIIESNNEEIYKGFMVYNMSLHKYYTDILLKIARDKAEFMNNLKKIVEQISLDVHYLEFDRGALLNEKKVLLDKLKKISEE